MKLEKQRAGLDIRKYNFTVTIDAAWNSLSDYVITAATVNTLKIIGQIMEKPANTLQLYMEELITKRKSEMSNLFV